MVANMIMMYEYAIKVDHNKFAKVSNVSQSMHGVQTCGEYDMSIEHDMCEHNQQIWRWWYKKSKEC